jgi:TRAP-type transport system small permease protein
MRKKDGLFNKKLVNNVINKPEELIVSFFLLIMFFSLFLQLLFRYVLKNPLGFTEEVARYSYIWLTFIGVSLMIKKRGHIRIDYFVEKLPLKIKIVVRIMSEALVIIICLYLLKESIGYLEVTSRIKSPALQIPRSFLNISMIIGFAMAAFRGLQIIVLDFRKLK